MAADLMALVGLGLRARTVVVGSDAVRAALKRGNLALVVVAQDHSRRTADKVLRLASGLGVQVVVGPRAEEMGRLAKRSSVQAMGVADPNLARGIAAESAQKGR